MWLNVPADGEIFISQPTRHTERSQSMKPLGIQTVARPASLATSTQLDAAISAARATHDLTWLNINSH